MQKMITNLVLTVILILTVLISAYGQPGLPPHPSQAPIDGGLIWLIVGGGAYAVKKIRDQNKK